MVLFAGDRFYNGLFSALLYDLGDFIPNKLIVDFYTACSTNMNLILIDYRYGNKPILIITENLPLMIGEPI
ncbi:hypothetical protein DSOL_4643 [Desulfosporosinus metallidurans]|uniref:Uncharacterized protein n=1 Tax=Desulfosporosinus metallidurans TaxID=1888891 RepID=A0A1Q8QIW7_9FIRM|nr:hypothetical protein DSOL_4643 [Desulfosporosinus metallidurans]